MATDPVCRMTVDKDNVSATVEYEGKTYFFCSAGCKERFEDEPDKYINGESDN